MIYIGLWILGMSLAGLAAEVYPTMRRYMRKSCWQERNEARVKTTIIVNNRRNTHDKY